MRMIEVIADMNHAYLYRGTKISNLARCIAGLVPYDIFFDFKTNASVTALRPEAMGRTIWHKV